MARAPLSGFTACCAPKRRSESLGSRLHLAGYFHCVLGTGLAAAATAGGEQCGQGIAGVDRTLAAHGPGSRAGVLGLVFLDTKVFKVRPSPGHSWSLAASQLEPKQYESAV